jgi:glycosidase
MMIRKAILAAAALLLACNAAFAAPDCKPSPLGKRELFVRGSFNNWAAQDDARLRHQCNGRYELIAPFMGQFAGEFEFKIADEDWSDDADFGGTLAHLQRKGPALKYRFSGVQKLVFDMSGTSPTLSITPCEGCTPTAATPSAGVSNPIALSLRFDSRAAASKLPFGAVTEGTTMSFNLAAQPGVGKATLVIEKRRLEGNQEVLEYAPLARVAMTRTASGWTASYRFDAKAIYGYYFEAEIDGQTYVYQNNKDVIYWTREKGSMGMGQTDEMPDNIKRIRRYRQTVFAADFKVPAWASDAVYYYIFPERFRNGDKRNDPMPGLAKYHDKAIEFHKHWNEKPAKPGSGDGSDDIYNNDFFGGDLAGIIDKLDYIKALGANTIYMTPIFKAASNHKYDTADYTQVDPGFGSNADFVRLCAEAAKRGIRVLPDTSLNHTGADSVYFDRYGNYKSNGAFEGGRPNPGSPYASWYSFDTRQTEPDKQYKGWVGVADLPELNKASPSFRAFAYGKPDSVMLQWLDRGAAGWRMDVAPWVPDDFWHEWRAAVKAHNPDAITVAETWFDASKFFLGDSFDSSMNYIFRNTVLDYAAGGDARKLYGNIELMREAYPPQAFYALMNLLSSHDQPRALHHLGYLDDGNAGKLANAKQRLRLALLFQMSFPGAPAIYYGDEVGVAGGDDPYNRATYPWADEGGQPDVALLADFKRLTRMRHAHPVLRHGSIGAPLLLDANVVVLARQLGDTWAITATNNGAEARTVNVTLPAALAGAGFQDALTGAVVKAANSSVLTVTLPPLFGSVLISR